MGEETTSAAGGCLCGALRFELTGPPAPEAIVRRFHRLRGSSPHRLHDAHRRERQAADEPGGVTGRSCAVGPVGELAVKLIGSHESGISVRSTPPGTRSHMR